MANNQNSGIASVANPAAYNHQNRTLLIDETNIHLDSQRVKNTNRQITNSRQIKLNSQQDSPIGQNSNCTDRQRGALAIKPPLTPLSPPCISFKSELESRKQTKSFQKKLNFSVGGILRPNGGDEANERSGRKERRRREEEDIEISESRSPIPGRSYRPVPEKGSLCPENGLWGPHLYGRRFRISRR